MLLYWRDARQADLVKIRWLGPATVILREDDPTSGRPHLYWIAHGTQLLRCALHHVRADFRTADTVIGGLVEARRIVGHLKSRGVTRYTWTWSVSTSATLMMLMRMKRLRVRRMVMMFLNRR